jgi:hypothetical protein
MIKWIFGICFLKNLLEINLRNIYFIDLKNYFYKIDYNKFLNNISHYGHIITIPFWIINYLFL